MNQNKLIKSISDSTGIKKRELSEAAGFIWKSVTDNLVEKKKLILKNFGDFRIVRRRTGIYEDKNDIFIVIPPKNTVVFNFYGKANTSDYCPETDEITNNISLRFFINANDSVKIVNLFFNGISKCLNEGKSFKAAGFGEFKVTGYDSVSKTKTIKLILSRKLSGKINNDFDNLKVKRIYRQLPEILIDRDEFNFTISDEFKQQMKMQSEPDVVKPEQLEKEILSVSSNLKRLISEELLKLHKEITELGFQSGNKKEINLWR